MINGVNCVTMLTIAYYEKINEFATREAYEGLTLTVVAAV